MSQAQRLRDEISLKLDTGSFVNKDWGGLREKVGSRVIKALDNEQHPIAAQLLKLKLIIDHHRAPRMLPPAKRDEAQSDPAKIAVMSDKHFFMPHPGISFPTRQFWPLQLLLLETACSSYREALAFRLNIDAEKIAGDVREAAKESVDLWSLQEHVSYLHRALRDLDYPDPPLTLAGNMLSCGGQEMRLSPQQMLFVQLLIETMGEWVTHEQCRQRRIPQPGQDFSCDEEEGQFKRNYLADPLADGRIHAGRVSLTSAETTLSSGLKSLTEFSTWVMFSQFLWRPW